MKELVYSRMLLPQVERTPDKVGFIEGDTRRTFSEHVERVGRLSSALRSLGVGPDDRYAVLALNCQAYMELWHAAFLGAGVINPLNLRLAAKELTYIIQDSGTKVVFTDFLFGGVIDQIRDEAGIEHVILIGPGDIRHEAEYEELLAAQESTLPAEPEETDPVVLMYTGGTTGLPKGVLLEHRAQMLNLYHIAMLFGLDGGEVNLNQVPMFHAATMGGVLGIPATGGVSTYVALFDPAKVMDAIETHQVNFTVMVPTMIALMLNHPDFRPERLASLTRLTYGASPMPTALLTRLLDMYPNLELFQGYGMTEASAILTVLGPEEHRQGGALLKAAGRAVPGVMLSIQDPDGTPVPHGEVGEVCARAGNFMREYWKKPEATEEVFRGGWYHSGDAGYIDDAGYLFLVDRVKDMIVTGGENVYSVEVENAIATHPEVVQVAVIGIPHDTWGEAVHAIIVVAEGAEITEADIIEHARPSIAGFKLPKSVEFRTEPLPLSGAMKILKRDLRAPYWEGEGRGVG